MPRIAAGSIRWGTLRRALVAGACTLTAGASLAAAQTAAAAGFLAGAGVESTTPPAQGSSEGNQANSDFAGAFSTCLAATFPDAGRFALQEPFNDQNGNKQWDPNVDLTTSPPSGAPEPYCDANTNGHWDGIYQDNEKGPATGVHDQLEARAVAISDGVHKPV
ncbi:MAG: hypothetical protein JOZ25_08025, partial [Actinobacteria bacterium]|nr:hypothetical protein [Actinomycetota bacterium]